MDNATAATLRRILRNARTAMGLEARRADPGAFTAYALLAADKATADILAAGYLGVKVEVADFELVAFVYDTACVSVAI